MNAFELYTQDGKSTGLFVCGECKIIYSPKFVAIGKDVKESAEECCNRKCKYCEEKLEKQTGYTVCDKCRKRIEEEKEKERFEKAQKIMAKEWDGPVFTEYLSHNDGYFENMDDLEDYLEDHNEDYKGEEKVAIPEYVWACNRNKLSKIDVYDVCEGYVIDYLPEDWDLENLNGLDDLQKALDKFVADNQDVWTYDVNYKKAIIIEGK